MSLLKIDADYESNNYSLKFSLDKLDRFTIECESPDFDIGMSEEFMTMVGIVNQPQFKYQEYRKRRIFQSYLLYAMNDPLFLRGRHLMQLGAFLKSAKPSYPNNLGVLIEILDILPEQVWSDCVGETPDNQIWPKNTPWEKYIDIEKFRECVDSVQKASSKTANERKNIKETFYPDTSDQMKGAIVLYYMLKTITEDQYFGRKKIIADIPPSINYPNDTFIIYSDIINPEIFNDSQSSLLAIIKTNGKTGETQKRDMTQIQYKYLSANKIRVIHIFVSNILGREVNFQCGPLITQLHFIREKENHY